ncbi:TIGR04141 family sporadically distributed protein [Tsukamurella sp. 8F]|uniref:DUF6119 family protein n=1 Tax=unclassified Tsukamurella TaxID=2633480 RepID=UPI0023B95E85|nr:MULTISPECIES: DUF6119 family protein [unclassified Tsukamurella]MDF0529580.1 TIGR04141 family sporadically distributed protein [Tsukamurella sp. 8J]MDF0585732.1 TIGR04141 family sporadically distributed protein [Tsukamurella sp. 8F]
MSLYRLVGLPSLEAAIREKYSEFTQEHVEIDGTPGLLYWGSTPESSVKWGSTLAELTGTSITLKNSVPAAVLLIPDDGTDDGETVAWALSFGMGFQLLDQRFVDNGFGQRVAIRCANPMSLQSITKTSLDERAKTDRSSIPAGAPLRSFGFEDIGEVASRVVASGQVPGIGDGKFVTVKGADALSMPLACKPKGFLGNISRIKSILSSPPASDELADLERLVRIKSKDLIEELDEELLDCIASDDPQAYRLGLSWPHETLDEFGIAQAHKITGAGGRGVTDGLPSFEDIIAPLKKYERNMWPIMLAKLAVFLYESTDPNTLTSARLPLRKWLTYETEKEGKRYFLHSGTWYIMDQTYADSVGRRTHEIFEKDAPISDLQVWRSGVDEAAYNEELALHLKGLCLDKDLVSGPGKRGRIEACDVMLPGGTFIHVKHVHSSAPASHLIAQALVSTDTLTYDDQAKKELRAKIKKKGGDGNTYPVKPKNVVIVLAREKTPLSADNLFTFTRVNLGRQVRSLAARGIEVYVVPVLKETSAASQ